MRAALHSPIASAPTPGGSKSGSGIAISSTPSAILNYRRHVSETCGPTDLAAPALAVVGERYVADGKWYGRSGFAARPFYYSGFGHTKNASHVSECVSQTSVSEW